MIWFTDDCFVQIGWIQTNSDFVLCMNNDEAVNPRCRLILRDNNTSLKHVTQLLLEGCFKVHINLTAGNLNRRHCRINIDVVRCTRKCSKSFKTIRIMFLDVFLARYQRRCGCHIVDITVVIRAAAHKVGITWNFFQSSFGDDQSKG